MKHRTIAPALTAAYLLAGAAGASLLAGSAQRAADDRVPDQGRTISGPPGDILPQRQRPAAVNRILEDRLNRVLPALMREAGLDMWVVINREYAEDPVYLTLVPEPVFAARRTTILVFHDRGPGQGVERLTVSRYPLGTFYSAVWKGGSDEDQWRELTDLIAQRQPRRIGINTSREWAFGDGLTAGLHARLMDAVPPALRDRVVSADALCVRWLETRTALEVDVYPHLVALARGVVAEAFSDRVITPGVTTTDDVAWYIRQRFADLDLPIWFMPYVNVQRNGMRYPPDTPFFGASGIVERGDVLHTDVGIHYLRLATDTQEMGYVLRVGEDEVPEGLTQALRVGNRWQDLLTAEFVTGRTGNEILARVKTAAAREGIDHRTYSHPIGFHGHGAGLMVGMWDMQEGVPVTGGWRLSPDTTYAIEGDVRVRVPEWDGQVVQIKLEQSALFDGRSVRYLAGRQTSWHVVR